MPAGPVAASAERRLVTVLFADLVGFTTLAEDRDPESVRDLLAAYFERASEIIALHGGTVEKFIGDAVMAVWGTPVAHEDDAERAVRAALELVEAVPQLGSSLQARAGLLTGEAAVTLNARNQGMVAGDLVNTAARLQGIAEPGTVLVGEATMRVATRSIVFEPLGDHALRGKTAPVPAWRAVRVVAARGGEGRADALEPPFVGRIEELRTLKDLVHAVARERRLRLVAVTGPAGIGKSRLVWELEKYVDGISEDVYWHRGRSPSYGEGIAFWALGEMVRRRARLAENDDEATTRGNVARMLDEHVPEAAERERISVALLSLLGVDPAPTGGRDALFPAWRRFFERVAASGTTVLVFEDLQWADSGLLDFIDHLVDWSRGLPILVIALARPELFARRPELGLGRRHFTALPLDPLPDAAMRELLAGLVPGLPAAAVDAVVRRAEGVPLYAVETVRSLLADGRIERDGELYRPAGDLTTLSVPESLRSLIAARLDMVAPADRTLLQDAAILGQVFDAGALAAMTGRPIEEINGCLRDFMRRELVDVEADPKSPERGQYKFVQSLIREVAYGTLARRERRTRHLAAARHFEATGDEETSAVLASHYLAAHAASDAGPEADALAVQARVALVAAGERAATLGAHDQAVVMFQQAVAITFDPRERADLLERVTVAARDAGMGDADALATATIEAWRSVGDDVGVARSKARLGEIHINKGHLANAVQTLDEAVRDAADLGARAVQAEALAYLSRAHFRLYDSDQAIAAADGALAIAEPDRLEQIVAEALTNKGSGLGVAGRFREGTALLDAAVELCVRHGWASREIRARNNLASTIQDEDPSRATDLALEAVERAREIGEGAMYAWLVGTAAAGVRERGGDWDWAMGLLKDARERTRNAFDRNRLDAILCDFLTARGVPVDDLVASMRLAAAHEADPDFHAGIRYAEGAQAFFAGDLASAFDAYRELSGASSQIREVAIGQAARIAAHAGRLDGVREMTEAYDRLPLKGSFSLALLAMMRGLVAALEDRSEDGTTLLHEAVEGTRRLGMEYTAACVAAAGIAVMPQEPSIRALAPAARAIFQRVGAVAWLPILDRDLGRASADARVATAPLPSRTSR